MAFAGLSCNEPDEVGLGVQPASDQPGVNVIEVNNLTTFTVKEDSLLSSSTLSPLFLGSLNDPAATGITSATFYAQVRLTGAVAASPFGNATTPDSVILSLAYTTNGIYGDTNSRHFVTVYQLSETMSKDSLYYSTHDFSLEKLIGQFNFIPHINDSVVIDSITKAPQLRIPLDSLSFGKDLMTKIHDQLPDNTNFLSNIMKGIYVYDSTDGTGSILNLLQSSSLNRLIIYYHEPGSTDYKTFELEINDASARSLRFRHEYCNPISGAGMQVCFNNSQMTHDTLFIQSLAGLKTKILLPDWNKVFNNHKVSINRADLVVSVKSGTDDLLKPHDNLLLLASDSAGKNVLTIDFLDLGGGYDASSKEYKLNMTRHLQRILNGSVKDYGLYLVAGGSTSNARRTVLNGGSSVKLKITYTQQNN